jgi:hypothetical protein
MINFCRHPHGLIQWLYLRHCFLHAYFALQQLPTEPHDDLPSTVPSNDYVLLQISKTSKRINSELQALHNIDRYLIATIAGITSNAYSVSRTSSYAHSMPTMTSNWFAMDISKSSPSAQPVPNIIDICTPPPSSPLRPCNSDDTSSGQCDRSEVDSLSILDFRDSGDDDLFSVASTPEQQQDANRSYTSPSHCSSLPVADSNGCDMSLPGSD